MIQYTFICIAFVVALALPAAGQDVPMYNDTLWHINANEQLYPFNGYSRGLGYSPVTNTLYSGTEVGLIALYDAETGVLKDTILLAQMRIYGLDVSADGTRIYIYVQDSAAKRDYVTRAKGQVIEYPSKRIIVDSVPMGWLDTKISPDGRYLATGTNSVYDIQTGLVLSEEGTTLQGVSYAFALGGSRVIGCSGTSNDQFAFRLFDYKNQRMEVDTNLGKAGFGLQARTHGNKVAILTHTYMWILTVYSLPSMEKIWTTYFTESDGGGNFDFIDEEHVVCRKIDTKYGLGTWIYKIGTTVVGSTLPIAQAAGWGNENSITSKDGRFLFCTGNATLFTIDLRGLTSSVNDERKDNQVALIYPNPTNATSTIEYTVEKSGHVIVDVIDVHGAVVVTLEDQHADVGTHTVELSSANITSGTYVVRVRQGSKMFTSLMVVRH